MIEATTADALIEEIRARGGRVFRYLEVRVCVLTTDQELAKDLIQIGGRYSFGLPEGYNRCWFTKDGAQEWDIEIQACERAAQLAEVVVDGEDEPRITEISPARFPGLWEAARAPRHLAAV